MAKKLVDDDRQRELIPVFERIVAELTPLSRPERALMLAVVAGSLGLHQGTLTGEVNRDEDGAVMREGRPPISSLREHHDEIAKALAEIDYYTARVGDALLTMRVDLEHAGVRVGGRADRPTPAKRRKRKS